MFLTKRHLSRRTMLRGLGATIALPLLDAMIPAHTALAKTAAAPKPRVWVVCRRIGEASEVWLTRQIAGFTRFDPHVVCWESRLPRRAINGTPLSTLPFDPSPADSAERSAAAPSADAARPDRSAPARRRRRSWEC